MTMKFTHSGKFSFPGAMAPQTGPAPGAGAADALHWRTRGAKLRAAGDRKGAAAAYKRYLEAPLRLAPLQAAARALMERSLPVAEQTVRQFIARNPDDPVALRMLGQIAARTEFHSRAEAIFRAVLDLAPEFAPARYELANALLLQGKAQEGFEEIERLERAEPRNIVFLALKANALGRLGRFAESADLYRTLVDRHDDARLWVAYGHMLRTLRRGDEAIAAFRRAIAQAPHFGEAWWNLANMKTGALTAEDADALRASIADGKGSAEDVYHLRFALARALEETGDFAEAFAEYKRANAARAACLPVRRRPEPMTHIRRSAATFTPEFLAARAGQGDPSPAPIFILGMPRSGSTLLEQILSAHPLIEGTQELADIPIMVQALDATHDAKRGGAYPEIVADLDPARLRALGAEYLERARAKRTTERPFFLDKQPANWAHVGLIHLMLPNARIIEMRRDPLACCLSMFRQHFARGATYTYSIERLAEEYRDSAAMMAHYAKVAPGLVRRMELDTLQADLEGEVRGLLDHLGLPFAPECLRYFESDRAVFTPSSEQVRRPINRDGDRVLAQFLPHIGELREALGDLVR